MHPEDRYGDKLAKRAADLGPREGEDVLFRHFEWKQMATVFRKAKLTVIPSHHESFGISVLESFLFSVPVVAADTTALKEIVDHRRNGLIFANGNCDDLAAQMRRILTDQKLAAQLASKGKQALADGQRYSYLTMARKYEREYAALVDK